LVVAEKTKKERSNREKGTQYGFAWVLNEETIQEREAFCKFKDYWSRLSRIQPHLLRNPKKPVKKASKKPDFPDIPNLQLSPSGFKLLSPEKPEAPAAKPPTKGRTRKKKVADQVVEQAVNIDLIVPVLQTQSGRTCHDITLSRGCLIAGLPLILSERVEHYYKSIGWSLFYEIT